MDEYDRRHFIRTTIPGFLGLTMALPSLAALATRANAHQGRLPESGAINWDAFIAGVEKETAGQHLDHWNEAAYVKRAAAIASRLNLSDPALVAAFEEARNGLGNKRIDFYDLEEQRGFEVNLLQFEKHEQIRHHDHPGMTGVILCATGRIDVWNYDLLREVEDAGDDEDEGSKERRTVLLAQTGHATLRKGHVSTLTSKARNIHRLKARSLTQLVDVFAPPYNKERARNSTWFKVNPEPIRTHHGHQHVYEATCR